MPSESDSFAITLCLRHYYIDHRILCKVLISKNMKIVQDLKAHVANLFAIGDFDFFVRSMYLPDKENIRILEKDDVVIAVPQTNQFPEEMTVTSELKKLKKKRNIEVPPESTEEYVSVRKKTKKLKKKRNAEVPPESTEEYVPTTKKKPRPSPAENAITGKCDENKLQTKINYFENLNTSLGNEGNSSRQKDEISLKKNHVEKKNNLHTSTPKSCVSLSELPTLRLEKKINVIKNIVIRPGNSAISNNHTPENNSSSFLRDNNTDEKNVLSNSSSVLRNNNTDEKNVLSNSSSVLRNINTDENNVISNSSSVHRNGQMAENNVISNSEFQNNITSNSSSENNVISISSSNIDENISSTGENNCVLNGEELNVNLFVDRRGLASIIDKKIKELSQQVEITSNTEDAKVRNECSNKNVEVSNKCSNKNVEVSNKCSNKKVDVNLNSNDEMREEYCSSKVSEEKQTTRNNYGFTRFKYASVPQLKFTKDRNLDGPNFSSTPMDESPLYGKPNEFVKNTDSSISTPDDVEDVNAPSINFKSAWDKQPPTEDNTRFVQDVDNNSEKAKPPTNGGESKTLPERNAENRADSIVSSDWSEMTETSEPKRKRKRVRKRKRPVDVKLDMPPPVASVFTPPVCSASPKLHIRFDEERKDDSPDIVEAASPIIGDRKPPKEINGFNINAKDRGKVAVEAVSPSLDAIKISDVLVFKILKIGECYTPEYSKDIIGRVQSVNTITEDIDFIIIEGHEEFEEPIGKFSLITEEAENEIEYPKIETEPKCVSLKWNSLISPRSLYP